MAAQFPQVRLLHFPERKFPGAARNSAVGIAKGDVLAFLDADSFVPPDWLATVDRALDPAYAAVGGALDNGNPESYVGWAHYFFEFSAWIPTDEAREQVEIPAGCLYLRRAIFDRYGPFAEDGYSSDSAFCWRIREAGERLLFCPQIRVFHRNTTSALRLLRNKFQRGRWFGLKRVGESDFSRGRRLLSIAVSPVLPILLFRRAARRVRRGGVYRARFRAASPLVFLTFAAWSL